MNATLDHIVLWTEDMGAALDFYLNVVGLAPVRAEEWRAGTALFPSVRVSATSVLDLMGRVAAPVVDALSGSPDSAGHRVNHVCLAMPRAEYEALRKRLEVGRIGISTIMKDSFGAQGSAPEAFYFKDPDGNVIEARYYEG